MYRFDTTWIALAAGVLFSLMVSGGIREAQQETARESFRAEIYAYAVAVGKELDLDAETLYVLKGLFEGSESVTPEEFKRTARESYARHRDIVYLAWVPRVVSEVDNTNVQYPIRYMEPGVSDGMLGVDLGEHPDLRRVIENAGDGGFLVSSSALTSFKPNIPGTAVMMALPIYRGMPLTLESRRAQFQGVVVAVVDVESLVQESLGSAARFGDYDMTLVSRDNKAIETFLYQHGVQHEAYDVERSIIQTTDSEWFIKARPATSLLTGLQELISLSIGLIGVLLFMALGFLHAGVQNRNKIISARVSERTQELHAANEQLARLSSTDQLTGVDNRRELDRNLNQEWQRMAREQQPLSVMMIDVDHFKAYNDNYGHQAGDACLIDVVNALQEQLKRAADRIARYGGEEFVIILSNTGEEAAILAEECRSAVESARLPHEYSTAGACVTISIGLATIVPDLSKSAASLVAAADSAVYQAKRQGRNRVVIAAESEI